MEETQEEIEAREAEEVEGGEEVNEGGEKTVEELKEELKESREELEKERAKEKNFKGLKDQEKGKRKKIADRVDDMEAQLKQERENRQNLQDSIMGDAKELALDQLAGSDKDLRERLMQRVKDSEAYLGAPKDSKELVNRYEKAYGFEEGARKRVDPLHAFNPVTGSQNDLTKRDKRYTDTAEGKAMYEKKFPKIAAIEKKLKDQQ